MKRYPRFIILSLLFASCSVKRIDTSQMAAEMKNSEVKRITATQISTLANEWGSEITEYLNKSKANEQNIDSLKKLFNASIKKIELSNYDLKLVDPKEAELIKAYQYNLQNGLPITSNLQKIKGGEFQLYTAPVSGEKQALWWVEFSKKEIIKRVNIKEIKKIVTE